MEAIWRGHEVAIFHGNSQWDHGMLLGIYPKEDVDKNTMRLGKWPKEEVKKDVEHNGKFYLVNEYVNSRTKLKLECVRCRKQIKQTYRNYRSSIVDCVNCDRQGLTFRKGPVLPEILASIFYYGLYTVLEYDMNKETMFVRCNACSCQFEVLKKKFKGYNYEACPKKCPYLPFPDHISQLILDYLH